MRTGIILHFLLLLSATAYSQECRVEGQRIKYQIEPGVNYSVSHGYCYHYNSTTIETGYKQHYVSVTFMTKNLLRATPRMVNEQYIGYTYDVKLKSRYVKHVGASAYLRVNNIAPVGRFYIDIPLYKPLYLHGSVIQVSNNMTHLIGGLKLTL